MHCVYCKLGTEYAGCPRGNVNILEGGGIVTVILSKNVYMYICPILNGFPDRAISPYRSLDLVPNIAFHCSFTAPLYEASESV